MCFPIAAASLRACVTTTHRLQVVCLVGTSLVGSTPELCRYADVGLCIGPVETAVTTAPSPALTSPQQPTGASRRSKRDTATATPLPHEQAPGSDVKSANPYLQFASAVASLPCSVTLPPDVPLKVFVKVLSAARRSLQAVKQCLLVAGLAQVQ